MSDASDTNTTSSSNSTPARTDVTCKKRTGDQAFGSTDDLAIKTGRSLTPQPTPQAGNGEETILAAPFSNEANSRPGDSEIPAVVTILPVEMKTTSGQIIQSVVVTSPASQTQQTCIEVSQPVMVSDTASTISNSKSDSGSANSILQADESGELDCTDSGEIDEGFRALADLIDSSSKKCTYGDGYLQRQLVYGCRTCTLDVLEPAGFCMACAVHCHDEHDVIPMLTRRDFRCDCGNGKFGPRKCQLTSGKDTTNAENAYNQNFHGTICTCKKTLEASGSTTDDEDIDIVQCRVCEEQFHAHHLGVTEDNFGEDWDGELVCHNCLNKHSFLQLYQAYLNNPENITLLSSQDACVLAGLRTAFGVPEKALKGFVFPGGWCDTLCQCTECMDMYQRKRIKFLLDTDDTFAAYEQREAKRDRENVQRASDMSPEDIFAQICDGFDTVTQVELAHWFNNLREVFVAFLQSRIQNGQTITDADIEEFFATYNNPENDDRDDGDRGAA